MSYDTQAFEKSVFRIKEHLESEFKNIRTGQATISFVEGILVEAYGSLMPLNQVASLSVEDARTIKVSPWDSSLVGIIDKGITKSDLGVTSSVSEGVVRIHFPQLTGETREKIARLAKEKHEEARVALRNERNKALQAIEAMDMSEDEAAGIKHKLEAKVGEANKEFDSMLEKKQAEILG